MACRHRLIECTVCGLKLRGSVSALARAGLPTCACGVPMVLRDVEDAARVAEITGDEAILRSHPDAEAEFAAWTRKAMREITRPGNRMRCGGCSRYIAAANTHCGCGFVNDVRGRRNVGGYSAAPAQDPCPF